MTPVILTEVEKKHQSLPITPLHDLFHAPEQNQTTFRTCTLLESSQDKLLTVLKLTTRAQRKFHQLKELLKDQI
jgi:hypothetical protein